MISNRCEYFDNILKRGDANNLYHLNYPKLPDFYTVLDFETTMINLGKRAGDAIDYIKSGATGHTFKIKTQIDANQSKELAVKLTAYQQRSELGTIDDEERPENAEVRMLNLLGEFVKKNITPHIVLPVYSFHTELAPFILPENEVPARSKKYKTFLEKCGKDQFFDTANVLVSEWVNGGDLLDMLRKEGHKLSLMEWKVIIFQIIFTLAVIQKKYPSFRHNDLKANNILMEITNKNSSDAAFAYEYDNQIFHVPDVGMQIRFWDFDFATIPNIINNQKVMADYTSAANIDETPNRYYDVHYFFISLLNFFPNLEKTADIELRLFIEKVLPRCFRSHPYVHSKHKRLMVNAITIKGKVYEYPNEYCYPALLLEDDFFKEFKA